MKNKILFFTAITSFALPMFIQSGYYQTPEQSQAGYYGAMGGGYDSRSMYPGSGSNGYESQQERESREAYQQASESAAARESRNAYPGATGGTNTYPIQKQPAGPPQKPVQKQPAGPPQKPGVKSGVFTGKEQIESKIRQSKIGTM